MIDELHARLRGQLGDPVLALTGASRAARAGVAHSYTWRHSGSWHAVIWLRAFSPGRLRADLLTHGGKWEPGEAPLEDLRLADHLEETLRHIAQSGIFRRDDVLVILDHPDPGDPLALLCARREQPTLVLGPLPRGVNPHPALELPPMADGEFPTVGAPAALDPIAGLRHLARWVAGEPTHDELRDQAVRWLEGLDETTEVLDARVLTTEDEVPDAARIIEDARGCLEGLLSRFGLDGPGRASAGPLWDGLRSRLVELHRRVGAEDLADRLLLAGALETWLDYSDRPDAPAPALVRFTREVATRGPDPLQTLVALDRSAPWVARGSAVGMLLHEVRARLLHEGDLFGARHATRLLLGLAMAWKGRDRRSRRADGVVAASLCGQDAYLQDLAALREARAGESLPELSRAEQSLLPLAQALMSMVQERLGEGSPEGCLALLRRARDLAAAEVEVDDPFLLGIRAREALVLLATGDVAAAEVLAHRVLRADLGAAARGEEHALAAELVSLLGAHVRGAIEVAGRFRNRLRELLAAGSLSEELRGTARTWILRNAASLA